MNYLVDIHGDPWHNTRLMPAPTLSSEESRMLYGQCVGALSAVYDRPRRIAKPTEGHTVQNWLPMAILALSLAIAVIAGFAGIVVIKQRPNGDPLLFFMVLLAQIGAASIGIWLARRARK